MGLFKEGNLYRNIKNQKFYIIKDVVINVTNGIGNQEMVCYNEVSKFNPTFVREKNEFIDKFEPWDEQII